MFSFHSPQLDFARSSVTPPFSTAEGIEMRETGSEDTAGNEDRTDIVGLRVPGDLGTGGGAGGSVRSEVFGFGLDGVEATICDAGRDYMRPICALMWARSYRHGQNEQVFQFLVDGRARNRRPGLITYRN